MSDESTLIFRTIVVPIIFNASGKILICKKPATLGVFPGQWGLPGGGIEPGEGMIDALRRETREEVGLEVDEIRPLFFSDGTHPKLFADGRRRDIYMIFLTFSCRAQGEAVRLNEEFEEYAWAEGDELNRFDLNPTTRETLTRAGLLTAEAQG